MCDSHSMHLDVWAPICQGAAASVIRGLPPSSSAMYKVGPVAALLNHPDPGSHTYSTQVSPMCTLHVASK